MRYTRLGETDLTVSRICFGTWQYGGDWGAIEEREAIDAVGRALELGVGFFDTAQAYGWGASERLLARALGDRVRTRRDELVLATKGGLRLENGELLRDASAAWLRQGVEESLRNLSTDYIDLYQVHWPDPDTPAEETATALARMVEEGKIRYIGVSNYDVPQMREFQRHAQLDALQPAYHMFRRDIEEEILPYCEEQGIGVLVYGPLAHGLLAGRYTPQTTFAPDDWRSQSPIFRGSTFERNLAAVERLKGLASKLDIPVVQLAVAWTLARPGVDAAIVGVRRPSHIEGIVGAADIDLGEDELRAIDEILEDAAPVGGPSPEGGE